MIDAIRQFFQRELVPERTGEHASPTEERHDRIGIAACALLLEIANADNVYTDAERTHLVATLRQEFAFEEGVIDKLIELATEERTASVDLFQFTHLLSEEYGDEDKTRLMESAWRIVYADGRVSQDEQYLVRKIANLLDVDPYTVHQTKIKVEQNQRNV